MKSADAETWSLVQLPIETWTVLSEVRLFGRRRPVEPGGHRAARTLRASTRRDSRCLTGRDGSDEAGVAVERSARTAACQYVEAGTQLTAPFASPSPPTQPDSTASS
jgi:hypothetical protein